MGVALNDSLRGGRAWRAVQAQALVDASFMVAHRGGGRFDIARLMGATAPQWACWLLGTLTGLLLQPDPALLHRLGADVVFPAFFLLLVLDEVRSTRAAVAALSGAAIAGWPAARDRAGLRAAGRHRRRPGRPAARSARARGGGGVTRVWLSVLAVTLANWLLKASGPARAGQPDPATLGPRGRRPGGPRAPRRPHRGRARRARLAGSGRSAVIGVGVAGAAWALRAPLLLAVLLAALATAGLRAL